MEVEEGRTEGEEGREGRRREGNEEIRELL